MGRHSSHSSHSSRSSSSHHGSGGGGHCPLHPPPPPIVEPPCRDRCDDDLTRRFNREVRRSGYPTRYIVNDGSLVISESLLRDSNTLIYNRHGSRMRVLPDRCCCDGTPSCRCGCRGRRCCKGGGSGGGFNCCYCSTTIRIRTTTRVTEYCRSCVCRRASHGGIVGSAWSGGAYRRGI
ncbi:hypothetical protein PG984_016623 [Apiospora sp. TS-2023a]